MNRVCAILVSRNRKSLLRETLFALANQTRPPQAIVVVDNASTDDSLIRFKEAFTDPRVELLVNDKNQGYAGGNNRGWQRLWPPAASDPSRQLT